MGENIVRKILKAHLKDGELTAGTEIGIRIDQTLTQDATGTMAYLQFEAMGLGEIKTDLSVSYVDHNTVQVGFENNDDHRYCSRLPESTASYSRARVTASATRYTSSASASRAPRCWEATAIRPPAAASVSSP